MHAFLSFDLFQVQYCELQRLSELARRRARREADLGHASSHPPERRRRRAAKVARPVRARAAF